MLDKTSHFFGCTLQSHCSADGGYHCETFRGPQLKLRFSLLPAGMGLFHALEETVLPCRCGSCPVTRLQSTTWSCRKALDQALTIA